MLPIKTEAGKTALQNRDPLLSPRDRQLMILCNGSRTVASLVPLMGPTVVDDLARLVEAGFLVAMRPAPGPAGRAQPAVKAVQRSGSVQAGANAISGGHLSSTSAAQAPYTNARRSLAGTKMYIMDMLQLMRDMQASALAVAIHTSESETEFMGHVVAAAKWVFYQRGASYGMRIIDKLKEITPEPHLPLLHALTGELHCEVPA